MKKIVTAFFFLLCGQAATKAQDFSLYEKHWYVSGTDSLPYRLLLPENFDPNKKYPFVFFLHGAGERGNNNESQLVHGGKLFLKEENRKNYPAIVVFPQCPKTSYWSNVDIKTGENGKRTFHFTAGGEPTTAMKMAQELLHKMLGQYKVKKQQVYIAGLSMGGMGTFEMVYRNPNIFAAAMPICGGSDTAIAPKVKHLNWWIFHGAKDDIVPPVNSENMAAALKEAGASVKLTIYPNANHNSWDPAFAEPDFMKWMFSNTKNKKNKNKKKK